MGYMRHHAIIVSSCADDGIKRAYGLAKELFGDLVTNIVGPVINGYSSFAVLPDGSKEFWADSDSYDLKRAELISGLKDCWLVEWVELSFADEDGPAKILNES